jgi:Icc-related predicted phosphoesterase
MYTELQMKKRIGKLGLKLWWHKGFDILVTHAPAFGINDENTLSHRGFESFVALLERYQPKYFIHGHIHRNYGVGIPQKTEYGKTTILNAYEYCKFDY